MVVTQRRMLSAANSKLGKVDIIELFRKDDAWAILTKEEKEHLYSLLPEPRDGEEPHDPDVHPLNTRYRPYIEDELRQWQKDLTNGKETKKWRNEARQAGKDRADGKFDEWREIEKEQTWGKFRDENIETHHMRVNEESVVKLSETEAGETECPEKQNPKEVISMSYK